MSGNNKPKKKGGFKPGVSGNPRGRPKGVREYVRGLIGECGEEAYDIAWEIAKGVRTARRWVGGGGNAGPMEVDTTPSVKEQLEAAIFLIERLQGKAIQPMEHGFADLTDEQLEARFRALTQTAPEETKV